MLASMVSLFFWGARALYLGPAFGLSPHRNAVPVLCAGVHAAFEVARDPRRPRAGYAPHRTVLIPANTLHHLRAGAGLMAFLYVDAQSEDFRRLRASAAGDDARHAHGMAGETAYLTALQRLAAGRPWREASDEIVHALDLVVAPGRDKRVTTALRCLAEAPAERHALASVAAGTGLSPSRFLHLFKATTGVPFRRYRLWTRMGAAVRALAGGARLTDAALDAGFSSSAHFSAAFREMFGLAPSRLARAGLRIEARR
jgi:AraC-like DNA-binding protein